jgi:hypothetical protein
LTAPSTTTPPTPASAPQHETCHNVTTSSPQERLAAALGQVGRVAGWRFRDRELPARRYVDQAYPVCWWKGRDGVDEDALRLLLPQLAR